QPAPAPWECARLRRGPSSSWSSGMWRARNTLSNAKAGNGIDLGEAQGHAHARTPDDMRAIGRDVGEQLAAGTVVILTGPLGAGKTTRSEERRVGKGGTDRVVRWQLR